MYVGHEHRDADLETEREEDREEFHGKGIPCAHVQKDAKTGDRKNECCGCEQQNVAYDEHVWHLLVSEVALSLP